MQIQTVSVLLSSRQAPEDAAFTHEIYQTGPSAIPVTEIPIYQHLFGQDAVSMIAPYGEYEISKQDEYARLKAKFGAKMMAVYPTASIGVPKTIADLDLEPGQIEQVKARPAKAEAG